MTQQVAWPFGTGFAQHEVAADGFQIRYFEAGNGEPLVYLHGAGGLRMSPALDLLSQQFHVYAIEQPGFGSSAPNTRSTTVQEFAATVDRAIEAIGLERYNLVGTSFGGRTALWLALQAPEHISALVLESPAALVPSNHQRPSVPPEQRAALLYAHPERVPSHEPLPASVSSQQEALLRRLARPNPDTELEAALRTLRLPTLVLFGMRDALIPYSMGRRYRELMPNCHLVLVYDAGHAIGFDRPEAFSEVVSDFLTKHEAFVVTQESALVNP
jgi:4,5:9,10-diseco-3-hydroxy-5,9,17-trioxoandrosta-1(10),2-diene-4-oate hydrolase